MPSQRLLVLSDIHSNFEALRAVMHASLETFRPDGVVVAGDIVGYGPDPGPVIRGLRAHGDRLVAVAGNHDREARDKEAPCQMHADARESLLRNRDAMSSADVAFLRGLPGRAITGAFTVIHDPDEEYVETPDHALDVLDMIDTPHAIVGHTHVPGYFAAIPSTTEAGVHAISEFVPFRDGDVLAFAPGMRYVINPGSAGQPRDRDSRASFLEVTDDGRTTVVRARRVAYDIAATQAKMRNRGYPGLMADRLTWGW